MRTRSLPLKRRRPRVFPPSVRYEASLSFGEQGPFDLGQGLLLEPLHSPLDLVEGVALPFEVVGLPSGGEGVALVVFEDDADAWHGLGLLRFAASRGADTANLPRYAITGKWTGRKIL